MSLIQASIALIRERGKDGGTVDDILPKMPPCTRQQAIRALQNAATSGYLETDGRVSVKGVPGSAPTIYRLRPSRIVRKRVRVRKSEPVTTMRPISIPRVNSVWALAA